MAERLEMESPQQHRTDGAWRGYGLLAAAWLVVLAAGGVAGWVVHTGADADRPVRTGALHSAALPEPPAPTATALAGAIDPRFRQIATRQPGPGGLTNRPAAADDPSATTPGDTARTPAIPRIPAAGNQSDGGARADTDATAHATAQPSDEPFPTPSADPSAGSVGVQVAGRAAGPEGETAAGPMPPPVPRSVVSGPFGGAQAGSISRYSVQVGAFRQRENAVKRAAGLREAGYDVRIVHAFATHSRLYMVRLGQFDARPAAMAYARQLARDVAVETWPVRN